MFPRIISGQVSRPSIRSFAEIVTINPTRHPNIGSRLRRRQARLLADQKLTAGPSSELSPTPEPSKPKQKLTQKIPVREDHGLYAFFRRKSDDTLTGENRFEVVETPETYQVLTGRPWFASELRQKSFKDLHTLWYVCLREKNLLATQKEEVRRMGVTNSELQVSGEKVRNCRKTMARIKAVLNERRLAYVGAVELAEKEHAAADKQNARNEFSSEDQEVLKYQVEKMYGSVQAGQEPTGDAKPEGIDIPTNLNAP